MPIGPGLALSQRTDILASGARMTYSENKALTQVGYHRGNTVLSNMPEVFAIESTNYCNIKCVMCPRGEPDLMTRPLGHMDSVLLESIIDQVEFFTDPSWLHWFGEPLLNPHLFEQIEIAKRKVQNLGISTNATLLSEKNQILMLESGLDTIMIAIDGASKDVYERVRKSSRFTFESVISGAVSFLERRKALSRKKPYVTLSIIVMEETAPELESFKNYWVAAGADEV
ncbi:MAG: radical SAM protein, partial [Verrucomicrobia bacterium]|nr:radical SAM protein [Verrucomicrobiota bacterium]